MSYPSAENYAISVSVKPFDGANFPCNLNSTYFFPFSYLTIFCASYSMFVWDFVVA